MTPRPVAQSLFPELIPDRPTGALPLSVQGGDNADLIATIAPLYLTGSVLDVTYGRGAWWRRFTPDPFTFHDLALDGVDFRALPHEDRSFDAVCFDPPYVISGTHSSDRLGPDFQDRYGIGQHNFHEPVGDNGRQILRQLIKAGLAECARVVDQWLLVKCMEFAQGGKFHDIPGDIRRWGADFGLTTYDVIVHAAGTGPGGHNIWDAKRCRRAHSYLLVFEVPA